MECISKVQNAARLLEETEKAPRPLYSTGAAVNSFIVSEAASKFATRNLTILPFRPVADCPLG
jgi:hypothetical protein